MAKVTGGVNVLGTIDGVCFYEQEGKCYVRMKPGPDRKQFLKGKRYQPQREASLRMNKGNKIASLVYKAIGKEKKEYKINVELQRMAARLLKTGMDVEEVARELCAWVVREGFVIREQVEDLPSVAREMDFRDCVPGSGRRKDEDHFKGVKIITQSGRRIRIYHRDEWEILQEYEEEIIAGREDWVEVFLLRRKKLDTYRLRHMKKRRVRGMYDVRCEDGRCRESRRDSGRKWNIPRVFSVRYGVARDELKNRSRKERQGDKRRRLEKMDVGGDSS